MKVNIPDSWNDVSISQWQEIANLEDNKNKSIEIAAILLNEDPELIRKLDIQSIGLIASKLNWVNQYPDENTYKKIIDIDGKQYGFINRLTDLSGGEWVDLENSIEDMAANAHKVLAILYRPVIEIYDEDNRLIEPYDVDSMNRRAKLFQEKAMIGDVYGALLFFSTIEKECIITIRAYLNKQKNLMEKQNQKKKSIWQRLRELKNGIGIRTSIV